MASTGPDLSTVEWRRSSYSNSSGGDCVEVAPGFPDTDAVPVRDSKAAEEGPVLLFQTSAWTTFLTSLKH
jgi:hypothetical protein